MSDLYPPLFERDEIDGLKVVRDEVYSSGLSKHLGRVVPIHGIRVLTLEDDSETFGCRDCEFAGTLGQVRQHRKAEHGVSIGGYPGPRRNADEAAAAGLTALPAALPASAASMSLHELFTLAAHVDEWETVLTNLEEKVQERTEERDEARQRLRTVEKELAAIRKKAARAFGLVLVEEES